MRKLLLFIIVFSYLIIATSCSDNNTSPSKTFYETVKIGKQTWMLNNLNVDRYRNGDKIQHINDWEDWMLTKSGAWCYYQYEGENGPVYGKLYNWYAVNDPRGLAPEGWRIPSEYEWKILEMHFGMTWEQTEKFGWRCGEIGGKLKKISGLWYGSNDLATNSTGFSAVPGGWRSDGGTFNDKGYQACFWTSTEYDSGKALCRCLSTYNGEIYRAAKSKNIGYSVRCVK